MAELAYPAREPFFAFKYVRLLRASNAAATIGADGCLMLIYLAFAEDTARYSGPVGLWNSQLIRELGLDWTTQLVRIRKRLVDAGFLTYDRKAKRSVGLYAVAVPDRLLSLWGVHPGEGEPSADDLEVDDTPGAIKPVQVVTPGEINVSLNPKQPVYLHTNDTTGAMNVSLNAVIDTPGAINVSHSSLVLNTPNPNPKKECATPGVDKPEPPIEGGRRLPKVHPIRQGEIPERFNVPEVLEALEAWGQHFMDTHPGRDFTFVQRQSLFRVEPVRSWPAQKLVECIHWSIGRGYLTICDNAVTFGRDGSRQAATPPVSDRPPNSSPPKSRAEIKAYHHRARMLTGEIPIGTPYPPECKGFVPPPLKARA